MRRAHPGCDLAAPGSISSSTWLLRGRESRGVDPVAGEWLTSIASVRREVAPEVYAVLVELGSRGWRVRRQGHKFRAYCPCGDNGSMVRIDGTPRSPVQHARRALREAGHCPDRHGLDG
jgi:hypothetical protein